MERFQLPADVLARRAQLMAMHAAADQRADNDRQAFDETTLDDASAAQPIPCGGQSLSKPR